MLGQSLTQSHFDKLVSSAKVLPTKLLQFDETEFTANYNQQAFLFQHRLNEHPLFELKSLFELCRRMEEKNIKFRFGEIPVDAEFDSSLMAYRKNLTLDDAINNLVENRAYIAIYNPEIDEIYKPVIEQIMGEIGVSTQAIDPHVNWYSTYIFISSMGSITPYHMDREMNFLLHVRGEKKAQLWGRLDDSVMTSAERDSLLSYAGEHRPAYRESFESRALNFDLSPGQGIHHPFIAPHLYSTNSDVSISLAVTYRTDLSDIWTDAHACNYLLRKLAMTPGAVGYDLSRDQQKANIMRSIRKIKKAINPLIDIVKGRVGRTQSTLLSH